ncbi:CPBP family intramembrane glutamic endopeptidase [Paenibacillus sp. Marseille-Q9583]
MLVFRSDHDHEKKAYHGLLLTPLRSKVSERQVCILTSIIFGHIHGSNIVLGQYIRTIISQFFFAALMGFSLYIVRRVTGSLIWSMLLHGLWDV